MTVPTKIVCVYYGRHVLLVRSDCVADHLLLSGLTCYTSSNTIVIPCTTLSTELINSRRAQVVVYRFNDYELHVWVFLTFLAKM
jgi:hypothetical protein